MTSLIEIYQITQSFLQYEERKASDLKDELDKLKAQVDQIDTLMSKAFDIQSNDLSRQILKVDALWSQHLGQQRAYLMTRVASIRAQQEVQNLDLIQAFGKNEAIKNLASQEKNNALRVLRRKNISTINESIICTAISQRNVYT